MSKPDFKIKLHNTIYLLIMQELREAMTTAPNKYVEATINEKYVDYYEVYAPEIVTKRLEALFNQLIQDERKQARIEENSMYLITANGAGEPEETIRLDTLAKIAQDRIKELTKGDTE